MKVCALIGHRDCPQNIISALYNTIENLITHKNVSVFYVGTHGNFDRLAYDVLKRIQTIYSIQIKIVPAYLNQKHAYYETCETIFPDVLENTPLKYAIVKRNNYMIDNSDYLICYVNDSFTNAYTFAKRALKRNVNVINLGLYNF